MRASGRPCGSVPGRMKLTTLNRMIACRAKVSLSHPSLRRWRVARATMQHIGHGGQQPIARTARARSTPHPPTVARRFPSTAGKYRQNEVRGRPGGRPDAHKILKRRGAAAEFPKRANSEINRPIREASLRNREAPGNLDFRTNRKLSGSSFRLAAASSRSRPPGRKRQRGGATSRLAIAGKNLRSLRNCAEPTGGTVICREFEQDAPR